MTNETLDVNSTRSLSTGTFGGCENIPNFAHVLNHVISQNTLISMISQKAPRIQFTKLQLKQTKKFLL